MDVADVMKSPVIFLLFVVDHPEGSAGTTMLSNVSLYGKTDICAERTEAYNSKIM
jgi:hypothetical protein